MSDHQPPPLPGPPPFSGYPPQPQLAVDPPSDRGRTALWVGLAAFVAVAMVGAGLFYRSANSLPSVSDDQATIEAALPDDDEVPPGLVRDLSDSTAEDGGSLCESSGVDPRAIADRFYYEQDGTFGTSGFGVVAGSWATVEDAQDEVVATTAALLQTCLGEDAASVEPSTGSVAGADSSKVFMMSGIDYVVYAVVAQAGRFSVLAVAADPGYATGTAATFLRKL